MRITKLVSLSLTGLLLAGVTACGGGGADTAKTYNIKINSGLPPTHPIVTNLLDPWLEEVEEKTDGRVKGKVYNGEALGTLSTAIDDIESGVYEVGLVVPTYFYDSSFFPMTIGSLAFAYPDAKVGSEMFAEYIEAYEDELKTDDLVIASAFGTDPYVFFSKKPISSIADLKGVALKAQGDADTSLLSAWGAAPVSMPTGEVYEALDKNTITAAPYTKVGVMSTKFYEVAPYMTDTALWGSTFSTVINASFLDSLPSDLREIFEDQLEPRMAELALDVYPQEVEAADKALPDLLSQYGGKIVEVSAADDAKFRATGVKEQWEDWIALADKNGYDGKALVNTWFDLMEKNDLERPY